MIAVSRKSNVIYNLDKVSLYFNKDSKMATDNQKEIEVLKKYNNKYWEIIEEKKDIIKNDQYDFTEKEFNLALDEEENIIKVPLDSTLETKERFIRILEKKQLKELVFMVKKSSLNLDSTGLTKKYILEVLSDLSIVELNRFMDGTL